MDKKLSLVALVSLTFTLLSGCVLTKTEPLLQMRNISDAPNLAGVWSDANDERVTIKKTEFNNTYDAYPPDDSKSFPLRLTLERLAGDRYVVQISTPQEDDSEAVALTVAEIVRGRLTFMVLNMGIDMLIELGAKHGVAINDSGVITAYDSADGVFSFFTEIFDLEGVQPKIFTKR
jgi:hypothetical protein